MGIIWERPVVSIATSPQPCSCQTSAIGTAGFDSLAITEDMIESAGRVNQDYVKPTSGYRLAPICEH